MSVDKLGCEALEELVTLVCLQTPEELGRAVVKHARDDAPLVAQPM